MLYPPLVADPPHADLSLVVVIPCLNEPEIIRTLNSLANCDPTRKSCEVIVLVNDSEASPDSVKQFNQETLRKLSVWTIQNPRASFRLFPIYPGAFPAKFAGAGLARKTGMDEAVRRFSRAGNPAGVILSTDADTLFEPNYLRTVESHFEENKSSFAATINFKHRVEELDDPVQQRGIRMYEDYLHYYKRALEYTGFPHAIYTIGSAFAVRADAYVKQGGMNKRQAGEDFYFLQKLTHLGKLDEITNTCIYPSGRVSDRVPFGTGAAITKWMNGADDLALTYNFRAFQDLKKLFDQAAEFYKVGELSFHVLFGELSEPLKEFLGEVSFWAEIEEMNNNCSGLSSFLKRFFQKVDAFRILKYQNFVHEHFYKRQNLYEAIQQLSAAIKKPEA